MASQSIPVPLDTHQDLLLKVTPPRVLRNLVVRKRLLSTSDALRDFSILLVQAPPGFGKTSLLAQWRKEIQATGTAVAWTSSQQRDDPHRFVRTLALAVRVALGKSMFGRTAFEFDGDDHLEQMTLLLAELAQLAQEVALVIDEAEKLPASSRDLLVYLLRQAPSNVRVLVAARPEWRVDLGDLIAYGQCMVIDPKLLRFDLEEAMQLVQSRPGIRVDRTCMP